MPQSSSRPNPGSPFAAYWGDDAYSLERAAEAFRVDPTRFPAGPPERWRMTVPAADAGRLRDEVRLRLATGSLFGGGTLAVLSGIGPLVRARADREALLAALDEIAPGNGLVVLEETESGRREPPHAAFLEALAARGGEVRRFDAPREGALTAWIEARAREQRVTLGPGAAKELATRVGGFVREADVDRRSQVRSAAMELEKLALRRIDGGPITVDDVRELVPEAVPGSLWAFTDALGTRQPRRAAELLERLAHGTPQPVLVAVVHRRLRELIEVADRLARGETPGSLVRSMRLAPFRAETLARQAAAWTLPELEAALEGLAELDARMKGVGGASGEATLRLALDLWLREATGAA
jgi:DNA polymerase III delta subunit